MIFLNWRIFEAKFTLIALAAAWQVACLVLSCAVTLLQLAFMYVPHPKQTLGCDFHTLVSAIFDAVYVATALQIGSFILGNLLDELGCPTTKLYNTGNGANFNYGLLFCYEPKL
jgi:hypothetical protein